MIYDGGILTPPYTLSTRRDIWIDLYFILYILDKGDVPKGGKPEAFFEGLHWRASLTETRDKGPVGVVWDLLVNASTMIVSYMRYCHDDPVAMRNQMIEQILIWMQLMLNIIWG